MVVLLVSVDIAVLPTAAVASGAGPVVLAVKAVGSWLVVTASPCSDVAFKEQTWGMSLIAS